jgi:PleD family two-component response regulator
VKKDIQKEIIENILKYTIAVTRSSDVVGQLNESAFGIILTNATIEGANVVAEKITKYISEINFNNETRMVDVSAILAHEMFILKNSNFDDMLKTLDEESSFISVGIKLKEQRK